MDDTANGRIQAVRAVVARNHPTEGDLVEPYAAGKSISS